MKHSKGFTSRIVNGEEKAGKNWVLNYWLNFFDKRVVKSSYCFPLWFRFAIRNSICKSKHRRTDCTKSKNGIANLGFRTRLSDNILFRRFCSEWKDTCNKKKF